MDSSLPIQEIGLQVGFRHFAEPATLHRHSEIEMIFAEDGAVQFLFGGKPTVLERGQAALFWAVVPHLAIKCEANAKLWWVKVPTRQFYEWKLPDEIVQALLHGRFLRDPEPREYALQLGQLNLWHRYLETNRDELRNIVLLEVQARMRELAIHALREQTDGTGKPRSRREHDETGRVDQMIVYIARNYTEPLTVDTIALQGALQPSYAMRLFRERFGTSIMNYVTQHRVAHAQRLLVTTDASVLEILLDAGFGSVTQFYTLFKRHCGCTPVEYRNAN
jgi:AraC-like DNA-binding protein